MKKSFLVWQTDKRGWELRCEGSDDPTITTLCAVLPQWLSEHGTEGHSYEIDEEGIHDVEMANEGEVLCLA